MPTSSERNYAGDMPRIAPDYLREWAEKRNWKENALLFRCDWLTDPMTEIRSKAARCKCTACGESFWTDWISGGMCRYGGVGGIRLWETGARTPGTERLPALAEALGCGIGELFAPPAAREEAG